MVWGIYIYTPDAISLIERELKMECKMAEKEKLEIYEKLFSKINKAIEILDEISANIYGCEAYDEFWPEKAAKTILAITDETEFDQFPNKDKFNDILAEMEYELEEAKMQLLTLTKQRGEKNV